MTRTTAGGRYRTTVATIVAATVSACMVGLPATTVASAATSAVRPPLHTWTGTQAGEGYGWAISELQDVDGDHATDAVIGAPFFTSADGANAGQVDVRSTGTGAVLADYVGQPGELLGYAIADAGDVDGDGIHDVILGAPQGGLSCDGTETGPGRAYVRSGATGALLQTLTGAAARGHFGAAVGSAGDVNGDGHADLLVGAPCANASGAESGAAYVISGATGQTLRSIAGQSAGDHFGIGTAPVGGDLNRDGVADWVIGAADAGVGARGVVYSISGRTGAVLRQMTGDATTEDLGWFFVAGVGDLNNDGVPDIYAGDFDAGAHLSTRGRAFVFSGATGKKLFVYNGPTTGAGAGPGRGAGDVDGDGVPDVVVGSYTDSEGSSFAGRIDIYSGRTGGVLRTSISTVAGEELGFDAVGIGDVNGDGHADLLASAAGGDTVYVLSTS
jgi:hypothetical protein